MFQMCVHCTCIIIKLAVQDVTTFIYNQSINEMDVTVESADWHDGDMIVAEIE